MSDKEFERLIKDLKMGGNLLLEKLYLDERSGCVSRLINQTGCTSDRAEDLFLDALLVTRKVALDQKLSNSNVGGYLYTVAYRLFLKSKRTAKVHNIAVGYMAKESHEDKIFEFEDEWDSRQTAMNEAWSKMGDKCKKILKAYYLDLVPLKDLSVRLGYGSYDSMKTTKKRCFQKLKSMVKGKEKM